MLYRLLADLVTVFHFGFILFVLLGGLLVLRWPRLAWVHVPAAAWGVAVELTGWLCPLTPLELWLRRLAGQAGYGGGFVEHYIFSLVYPAELGREDQYAIGAIVLILNAAVYARLLWRRRPSFPPGPDRLERR